MSTKKKKSLEAHQDEDDNVSFQAVCGVQRADGRRLECESPKTRQRDVFRRNCMLIPKTLKVLSSRLMTQSLGDNCSHRIN